MADTYITLRTKMTDIYIALSYWANEMGIIVVWFCLIKCFQVHASFTWKQRGICWHSNWTQANLNRSMTGLAQSKKNSIKRHDNSTTLVFLWDKTTLPLIKWGIHGRLSSHLSNSQTNQSTVFTPTLFLFSPTPMLFIPWFDDQWWCPRLVGRPKATRRCPCPDGSLPKERFDSFFSSFCLKTSRFFIM
jgi:hypothetical protein